LIQKRNPLNQARAGISAPAGLDGTSLGRFSLTLRNLRRGRSRGEVRFDLYLKGAGRLYEPPVISALHFAGMGRWYRPWIEVAYENRLSSKEASVDLEGTPEEEELFKVLCGLLVPGAHIMVKYHNHPITAAALLFGIPPPATPIGYLLYVGGCRWYKDWYFAEGFKEGEEKLQATMPLDSERRQARTIEIRRELQAYLHSQPDPSKAQMEEICRGLARKILQMREN